MTHDPVSFRLRAVGDLQLGDSATCVGFGFRSRVSELALRAAFHQLSTDIGPTDIMFANLETPLSDVGLDVRRPRSRRLRGTPDYAKALRSGGISVVNVANNHALEHGATAFADSVATLERAGVVVCGLRGTDGWAAAPVIVPVRGLRVGFLGYSLRPSPTDTDERLHAEPRDDELLADVRRLRAETDHVIVSLHWGEEFVEEPSAPEVSLAHAIVDAGASAVLGHHPHVARPVERYGNAVIAYSLGNFAADMIWYPPNRRGLVLDCDIGAGGAQGVRLHAVRVEGSYLPRVQRGETIVPAEFVRGIPPDEYVRRARNTVQAQRRSLYFYTIRNVWRFSPSALVSLAATTLRGKVASRLGGSRDEIWG